MPLRFALHIGKFAWPGGGPQLAEDLRGRGRRRGSRVRRAPASITVTQLSETSVMDPGGDR